MEESGISSYTEIIKTIVIIIMILLATFIWHLACTWLMGTCLSALHMLTYLYNNYGVAGAIINPILYSRNQSTKKLQFTQGNTTYFQGCCGHQHEIICLSVNKSLIYDSQPFNLFQGSKVTV